MTDKITHAIVSIAKKGWWSGKERQCCRYLQTVSCIQIISMIFREELCRPPKKRSGLFVLASIWTDQVDFRKTGTLCAPPCDPNWLKWSLPLVRKDRRLFCAFWFLKEERRKKWKSGFLIYIWHFRTPQGRKIRMNTWLKPKDKKAGWPALLCAGAAGV